MEQIVNQFGKSPQPCRIQIKPSDTTAVVCPCGSEVFQEGMLLRKISALVGGDGKPKPLPTIYCVKCFKPHPDFLPPDLRPVTEV